MEKIAKLEEMIDITKQMTTKFEAHNLKNRKELRAEMVEMYGEGHEIVKQFDEMLKVDDCEWNNKILNIVVNAHRTVMGTLK